MFKISTNLLKDLTSNINKGVDNERTVRVSELLELKLQNNKLILAVTNTQFYLTVELNNQLEMSEDFHATVDADTFIKLVSKTTSEFIHLEEKGGNLLFTGDGIYTFPMELDIDGNIKTLPIIGMIPRSSFELNGDQMYSLYSFGNNEIVNDVPVDPVQKYYYFDNNGSITYTESPYLNNMEINTPFKILLNSRLAQLFSLFRGKNVKISLSKSNDNMLYQNKIMFEADNIKLVSFLPNDDLVNKFPSMACRNLQTNDYPGQVIINRVQLTNSLERLNLFSNKTGNIVLKKCGKLNFTENGLEIISIIDHNKEFITYAEGSQKITNYTCFMDLAQLLRHSKANSETNLIINYGNELCLMFTKDRYSQIIVEMENPESTLSEIMN